MIEDFKYFLNNNIFLQSNDKILLTVSGGADSVTMLDLFSKLGFLCGIAHCNFHLRGKDSDGDELFVKKLAKIYKFPFFKTDFDTKSFAKEKGVSIEMAARELRYNWFEKIRQDYGYTLIATAHHRDDIIETFFINLTRGTGIRGLTGIKGRNGFIIRPLLFSSRLQILEYIKNHKLSYREDATNADIVIRRNRLRHEILPLFKEINTAAEENIIQTINNLKAVEQIMFQKVEEIRKDLFADDSDIIKINLKKLSKIEPLGAYLFELLRPYGFNSAQVDDIVKTLNGISGKSFYSTTHVLVKDRNDLIVSKLKEIKTLSFSIDENDRLIKLDTDIELHIEKIKRDSNFKIPTNKEFAVIDCDLIKFPLFIKEWEPGDFFYPLGMDKKKKLSDYFIDRKFSLIDKKKALVLKSENQIVWLIGDRIDNRFKITDQTKNVLFCKIIDKSNNTSL